MSQVILVLGLLAIVYAIIWFVPVSAALETVKKFALYILAIIAIVYVLMFAARMAGLGWVPGYSGWLNGLNTTAYRIVRSVDLTTVIIAILLFAMLAFGWSPTDMQLRLLEGVGIVLLMMMGFDVLQYVGKRFSDRGYAASKTSGVVQDGSVVPLQEADIGKLADTKTFVVVPQMRGEKLKKKPPEGEHNG